MYLTSDLHFHHKRIKEFAAKYRPWDTMEEMVDGEVVKYEDYEKLQNAVVAFLDFISEKYNTTEFYCPYMQKLSEIVEWKNDRL